MPTSAFQAGPLSSSSLVQDVVVYVIACARSQRSLFLPSKRGPPHYPYIAYAPHLAHYMPNTVLNSRRPLFSLSPLYQQHGLFSFAGRVLFHRRTSHPFHNPSNAKESGLVGLWIPLARRRCRNKCIITCSLLIYMCMCPKIRMRGSIGTMPEVPATTALASVE